MDRLDTLRLFVRAAELGSFSKAAAEAGVQAAFHFDGVATIGTAFGGIPRGSAGAQRTCKRAV